MLTDKEILEKYPYCKEIDWMTGDQLDSGVSCIEDVPDGWRLLFLQMCDKINECGYPSNFGFCQIKEKYGELRVYTVHTTMAIEDIINIYSLMSRHICITCGKPNVPTTKGQWILPKCKKCYDEVLDFFYNERGISCENYEDVFDVNNSKIDTIYEYSKLNGNGTIKVDISDCVDRYINEWERINEI